MQCRHTVADWHRYLDPAGVSLPIMAACRLLVKDGEQARDPRGIACAYWGRQRQCPMYEGPGATGAPQAVAEGSGAAQDAPVAVSAVWPVRGPHVSDGLRVLVGGLTLLSLGLLGWTVAFGLAIMGGYVDVAGFAMLAVMTASISMATHILAALVAWAGR
jgi:hypothetical protein